MERAKTSDRIYWASHSIIQSVYQSLFSGDISGRDHPLPSGKCIIAVNHASHFDPPMVGCHLPRQLTYFARKSLWKPGIATWWLDTVGTIPVDRDGESDVGALRATLNVLANGGALILFPEGTRSPDGRLQPAKPGIGLIAARSQAPVLPCRIFNSHKALSRNSKLPNLNTAVHIAYGQLIGPKVYDPGRTAGKERFQIVADRIMERIAALKQPRALPI